MHGPATVASVVVVSAFRREGRFGWFLALRGFSPTNGSPAVQGQLVVPTQLSGKLPVIETVLPASKFTVPPVL